jgi:probable rRNA maturation factor
MDDDPAYDIAVTRISDRAPDCEQSLREAIQATFRRHQTPAAQISVALVNDDRMADLNELHLAQKGPTDVLAFDLRNNKQDDPHAPKSTDATAHRSVEGEIIVSVDTAAREASRRGHSIDAELALYAVHGILHLLGYNDHDEHDAARMHEVEDEILRTVGMGVVYRTPPR